MISFNAVKNEKLAEFRIPKKIKTIESEIIIENKEVQRNSF